MKNIVIDLKKVSKYLATDTFLFILKQQYMASRTRDFRVINLRSEDEKIGTVLFWDTIDTLLDSQAISQEEISIVISLYFGCPSLPLVMFDYWESNSTNVSFINKESASMFMGAMPMISIKPNPEETEEFGNHDMFFVSYNHDLFRLTTCHKRFQEVKTILETKYNLSLECFQRQMQLWMSPSEP